MLIALTGGTGFVGRHIAQQLQSQGHRLVCLVRETSDSSPLRRLGAEIVYGDLDRDQSLAALVEDCDVVVHAAAWRDGSSFQQVGTVRPLEHYEKNVLGSLKLLELARLHAGHFIFISSGAVYGDPPGNEPLTEESARRPADGYGAYKAAVEMSCEAYARQLGFNTSVLRPFLVIGLHERVEDSPFYDLVQRVVAGERVEVRGARKFVMVEDVAKAVALVLGREDVKGQAFNLCDGSVRCWEIAEWAREASRSPAQIIRAGPDQVRHEVPSEKIRSLGLEFGGRQALRAYIERLLQAVQPVGV